MVVLVTLQHIQRHIITSRHRTHPLTPPLISYIHHDDVEFARKSARSLATTGKQSSNKQATVIYPENLLHLQQNGLCVKYIGEVQKISSIR